jgi:hypothetical protein
MKRIAIACATLASALAVAGSATAANENSGSHARDVAAKQCAAEKKADRGAFKALYGEHAMRTCIQGTTPEARSDLRTAAKECKAELAADPEAYSSHGKCVSGKVRAERQEEVSEFKNAAKRCKAEREADADAFREAYGSNENGRNALGQCVAERDDDEEEPGA